MSQSIESPKMQIARIRSNLKSKTDIIKNSNTNFQYINEFFHSQVGRYVQIDCFVGSDEILSKYGYLVGVGSDYILLQDIEFNQIISIDLWSIKFMYVYYDVEKLDQSMFLLK
ncbi:hypothetical protein [Aminipila terrae]|uniref:Uncharacterized protein n=1 Tax=Aminipila terrae TaxID=2697030 RepID=A0A6P1MBT3_9FIRM|nr:hypothetical protein [Aminipila terrae]QHI71377.1 hypothetical protein Ami3637_02325 [Aminipila terrae]